MFYERIKNRKYVRIFIWFILVTVLCGIAHPVLAKEKDDENRKVVKVAYFNMGNYYNENNGTVESYDRAYLDKVEEYTNLKFEYVDCGTWKHALELLENHDVDLVGTAQWNEEREKQYEYCMESYGYTIATFATLKDNGMVYEDYNEIGKSIIGCTKDYVRRPEMNELFKEHGINPVVKTYDTQKDLENALKSGDIKIVAANSHTLLDDWNIVERFSYAPYYFISWKGNSELTNLIDDASIKMTLYDQDYINSILKKWLPELVTIPLTKEEIDCIEKEEPLIVYFDKDTKPLSWEDENGEMQGCFVDVCKLLEEKTGIKFKFAFVQDAGFDEINSSYAVTNQTFVNGTDLVKQQNDGVTDALLNETFSFYHRIGDDYDENASYSVAIPKNRKGISDYITDKYPNYRIVEYEDPQECMKAVNGGKVDLTFLCDNIANTCMIENNYTKCVTLHTTAVDIGIGLKFRGDNSNVLTSIINKGLSMITDEDKSKIELRYALQTVPKTTLSYFVSQHIVATIIVILFVLGLILLLAIMLAREKINKAEKRRIEAANQAKTDFVSRVSHDMRTPMNGILGIAELSKDENSPDELHKSIGKIQSSGEYLLGLINDTLDFQKIESGRLVLEPQVVSTKSVIENVVSMVRPTAEQKGVEFRLTVKNADLDCYVLIDPMRMKQIFMNLISNAIKFTPEGGTVDVCFECIGHDGAIAHDIITISDTGIGMSEKFLKDGIFKPFSQEYNKVTTSNAGSGLGLSIVKRLVELMNGTISVESEVGVGTKFIICLDFEKVDGYQEKCNNKKREESYKDLADMLRGKNILLTEDHPLNAEIAEKLLSKMGCNVTWVKNGQECIDEITKSEVNYYDVILMDVRMPVMGGIEAAKRIRCQKREDIRNIPIIAMTANAYDDDIKQTQAAGMNGHLAKPINSQLMYSTIADVCKNNKTEILKK